jgi:Zn ribbon nucleic-acid-binding protein
VSDYHLEPEDSPDWSFSPEHDVRCPECNSSLSGLNWLLNTCGLVDCMELVPCGHELSAQEWELSFTGRDRGGTRRFGNIIRTPKFKRKGS